MRILHILSSDDKYGSAQCFIDLLKHEVENLDIEPYVITPRFNNINRQCENLGVKNYVFKYQQFQVPKHDSLIVFVLKYFYHACLYYALRRKAIKELCALASGLQIDIIHTNTSVIDVGGEVSKILEIPHVWHLREFGWEDFKFFSLRFRYIDFMNDSNSHFIAISNIVKDRWIERGLKEDKIKVLYDGVKASKFRNIIREKSNPKVRFVMVGSYCEAKGQMDLISAVSKLPNEIKAKILVGLYGKPEGEYYSKLVSKVRTEKLENVVTFNGFSNDISNELKNYDVGVLCSRAEAFGRVTVEYMLAGLCPLISDTGANYELVGQYKAGLLYKQGDIDSLANEIIYLANHPHELAVYGKRSKHIAFLYYDIDVNIIEIIAFFRKFRVDM